MNQPPLTETDQGGQRCERAADHTINVAPSEWLAYEWLSDGRRTVMDAVNALGTPNLRSIVSALKAKGIHVAKAWRSHTNAAGKTITIREYWIDRDERERLATRIKISHH